MKNLINSTFKGIGIASFIFLIMTLFFVKNPEYYRMVAAAILIGVGFGAPAVLYDNEKIPVPMRALIHMAIGSIVMLLCSYWAGWLPVEAGWKAVALTIGGQLLFCVLIWLAFSLYYAKQSRQINQKIKDKEKDA